MTAAAVVAAALAGVVVGTLSGLSGVGGGILIVPFLYFLLESPEWSGMVVDPGLRESLSHATSLFVVIPTAVSGLLAYHKRGRVPWPTVVPTGLGAIPGAILGALVAVQLPGWVLRAAFGLLLVHTGLRMGRKATGGGGGSAGVASGRGRDAVAGVAAASGGAEGAGGAGGGADAGADPGADAVVGRERGRARTLFGIGIAVGMVSALMGVGGGVIAIPLLLHAVDLRLEEIAPTSIGIVLFAAPAGVLTYMVAGIGLEGAPPGAFGYLHLPVALAMIPGAVLFARAGARLNQRLGSGGLARLFLVLFTGMGLRVLWSAWTLGTGGPGTG